MQINKNEINLTQEEKTKLGYGQWAHEATRNADGARLYTSVSYNHATRGSWKSGLVFSSGSVEKLDRIPVIKIGSKTWTITPFGMIVREEGRS